MPRKLEIEIVGDASKLNKELASAQTATAGFATKFRKAALVAGAAGAGMAAVGVGLKKTVDAALESEKAQQRLESALKGAGVSMDKYGSSIQKNIDKTSRLAALDDEDLSDSFAKLVRTTGDVTKATEGMNLAADIARARNISLEASTKMVERAMSGNESAFSRIGLKLKETATAQDVLAAAQKKFGGAAEDYGKTSAAAQERLGVAFENIQEMIGAKVLPIVAKLAEALLEFLNWTIVNWPRFQSAVEDALDKVRAAFEKVRPIVEAFGNVVAGLVKTILAIFRGDWSLAWNEFKGVVSAAITAIKETIKLAWEGVKKAATELGEKVVEGVKAGILGIGNAAWNVINNISEKISEMVDTVKEWGASIGGWIKGAVVAALVGIGNAVWSVVNNIWEFASERVKTVKGWGESIAGWIKDGILDGFTGLGKAIWEKIKEAIEWVKDKAPGLPKLPSIDVPFIGGGPGERGASLPPSRGGAGRVAGVGLSPNITDELALGQSMGLYMSSGLRPPRFPGDNSDHIYGKAIDMVGSASQMAAFAVAVMRRGGVKDVFYDPLGYSLDNGRFWGATIGGHSDHVHVSTFDSGGWLKPGLTLAYNGTGRSERVVGPNEGGDIVIQVDGETLARVNRRYAEKHARRNTGV